MECKIGGTEHRSIKTDAHQIQINNYWRALKLQQSILTSINLDSILILIQIQIFAENVRNWTCKMGSCWCLYCIHTKYPQNFQHTTNWVTNNALPVTTFFSMNSHKNLNLHNHQIKTVSTIDLAKYFLHKSLRIGDFKLEFESTLVRNLRSFIPKIIYSYWMYRFWISLCRMSTVKFQFKSMTDCAQTISKHFWMPQNCRVLIELRWFQVN